ncbi:hypothetical protein HMPREF1222_00829 [Treponema vincentii F0403]|uniref:Uncharacterized protein n=1 Tax=Treponema vincentii F0403 TaxID=1125702 RepID=S3LCG3_9SPIR|nr:hypothetical protein HMPREF1222_00829 [Treponema vincentii F0403]
MYSPIEYLRPDGSGKVGVFGAAYDVGAGVEKVKVKYDDPSATEVTLEFPSGVQTDVGNGDVNFVTWKGEINVNSFADGAGKIVITPIDRANNEHAPIEVGVKLKKNSLTISSVELGTDLNRNETIANAGSTVETKTLALTYNAANPDGIDSEKYDWHGKADAGEFRFKNDKSQIKIVTGGGSGTKKYTLKCVTNGMSVKGLTELPTTGVIELGAADFTKIGQSENLDTTPKKRKLLLTIRDSNNWEAELTLDVIVDTKDRVAPTNTIDPFKWVSESENSLYGNSRDNGHIEIGTDLPSNFSASSGLMDSDDKVSGKISITGTAHDDQVITEIWAKIDDFTFTGIAGAAEGAETKLATYTSGSFSDTGNFGTDGWHFSIVSSDFSVETGHTVKWQLDWNTAKISGGVGLDKTIAIKVKDTAQTNAAEKTRKVDVVPYITGITTKLNTAYSSNPSVFNRSATGAYPVRNDETITVKGFNLKSGGSPTVPVSIGTISGTPTTNEIKVKLSSSAQSGELDVTVDSVKSINNINSNAVYNMQPNNANNDLLNDDTKLHVWKFNAVNTDTGVRYPTMRIGKDSGQTVGFVYGSGAQAVKMNLNGTDFGIDYSFTQWYDTGIAVDNTGKIYGAAMNSDSGSSGNQSNGAYANFGFYAWNSKTKPGIVSYYDDYNILRKDRNPDTSPYARMAYSDGYKKVALENAFNGSVFNSNRIVSPKIATNGSGKVYTAYYDASANQVKFRYGTVSGNPATDTQLTFGGALGNHNNTNGGSAAGAVEIASGETAGPYVAVGVVPEGADAGRAIVAWYDSQNQRLVYKYSTSASSYSSWSAVKVIDTGFVGWYVDLVADKDGGIHIAYYSAQNGDLKYAYLSKYDANPVVCSVDSYLSVGTNISIEVSDTKTTFKKYKVDETTGAVTEDGTEEKYVPYISYYMSSFTRTSNSVRVAYLAQTKPIVKKNDQGKYELAANIADGVKNDKYTGTWEAMTIPTKKIPLDYTVGVGIKKNASNVQSVMLGYGTTGGLETAILE